MSWRAFNNRDVEKDQNHFDFIVIGSGVGGLTVASLLGRYGKKVLVLEQHPDTVGGCIHSFTIGGRKEQFCSGTHYISPHNSTMMAALWSEITDHQPTKACPSSQIVDIFPGVGSFSKDNFEEVMGIRKKDLRRMMSYTQLPIAMKLVNAFFARIIWFIYVFFGFRDEVCMNWFDWCKKHEFAHPPNADKIRWIAAGDHSMPRHNCPAYAQGAIMQHYCEGISKIEGWMPGTVRAMTKKIVNQGGAVHNAANVVELIFEGERVVGVVTEDGSRLTVAARTASGNNNTGVIVSGAHLLNRLANKQLGKELAPALAMGVSAQHGSLFLVYADKTPSDLGLPPDHANLWIDEKLFISHKFDAANNSTIVYCITECPYFPRGAEYLEKKEEYADNLFKTVTALYPALKNYDAYDAATPATAEKWLASEKGCSYGLSQPAARFGDFDVIRALRPTTSVPGLMLVGQDSMFWGVVGAMASGWICAQDILTPNPLYMFVGLGPNIMKDVIKDFVAKRKVEKEIEAAAAKKA